MVGWTSWPQPRTRERDRNLINFEFIAGFGPISKDAEATHSFWAVTMGIAFNEIAPASYHADHLAGAKVLALRPLDQAAQATFGAPQWPRDRPAPQAWIELEVSSPTAVAEVSAQLRELGQEVLIDAHEEPWGQPTARLMSREGLLVGISHMPDLYQ